MTQKEIKELKELWNSKTLGEIKGLYSEKVRIYNEYQESIREKAQELANLDFNNKYYVDKAKNLMNDISFYKSYIVDEEKEINLLKPILNKKEIEGINQAEYQEYITNNTNIQVLIKAVNNLKQEFINDGCKVTINYRDKGELKTKVITLSLEETNNIYNSMLKETIMIIKDRIGNIKEVDFLMENKNRGIDGKYTGEKGTITINTILAGGYNIQELHYRTLVYQY
jgi:hypothetical protein